jgi:hypothetical protein
MPPTPPINFEDVPTEIKPTKLPKIMKNLRKTHKQTQTHQAMKNPTNKPTKQCKNPTNTPKLTKQ